MKVMSWLFNDSRGRWHGPFDTSQMVLWCRAGYFAPSVVVRAVHGTELRAAIDVADFAAAFGVKPEPTSAATASGDVGVGSTAQAQAQTELDAEWHYKDPSGNEQGPFSLPQMVLWTRSGFFQRTTLVRRSEEVDFRPLGNVFEFSDCFVSAASANAAMAMGAYVGAAQFDTKGRFRKAGLLDAHASQGLVAADGDFNQLVRHFDVDGYQEGMRRKKAELGDDVSLRANQTRYKLAKQARKEGGGRPRRTDDDDGDD